MNQIINYQLKALQQEENPLATEEEMKQFARIYSPAKLLPKGFKAKCYCCGKMKRKICKVASSNFCPNCLDKYRGKHYPNEN